jgi:CBS domain-containing protein
MNTIRRMLRRRNTQVWTVEPHTSAAEALALMAEKDIGALVVLDQGQIVGIVTERDFVRKIMIPGRSADDTRVDAIMTRRVLYIRVDQTVQDCMALMTDKHVRHLPVLDDGRLVAVLSIRDVVAHIISEQGFIIQQMENYIMDRHPATVN